MRHFYIGPAPFWYLWFSVSDDLEAKARAFVDRCGPWFAVHNGAYNPSRTPWRVRMCGGNTAPVAPDPPCIREWWFPAPAPLELSNWHKVAAAGRAVMIGNAPELEPGILWGPMSLAYVVREDFPRPPSPWVFWFGAPLRGQAFWRAEILRTTNYGSEVAGQSCREVVCLDGITPPSWTDELADRRYSYDF